MVDRSRSEIYSVDVESFRFVDANRGACANTGYTLDELRAMTPLDLAPETDPEALSRLLEPLRRGVESSVMFTATHRRKDGSSYPAEIHLEMFDDPHPLFVAMVRDVSERQAVERALAANLAHEQQLNKKLEEAQNQLLQSEKMASIGQLAAGVAHELNNPIGFVSSNLGSLESYLTDLFAVDDAYAEAEAAAPDCDQLVRVRAIKREKDYDFLRSDIVQLLAESKDGLARVAKIVKDLKDFSRAGEATMQWADLHQGLDSTLNIIWNELKYKCTLHKEYGELPEVWCVPAQLNQVFMNLLVNAAHAIPEAGDIVIRTGRQGDQVFVAISDSGVGIAAENLNRIFEPFFTTKPVGQGTGLGLSLSYSIVKKHQGRIEVESTPGKGTTFTVWLPINAPDADAPAKREG
jgi:PAS domain S-box-containing protein